MIVLVVFAVAETIVMSILVSRMGQRLDAALGLAEQALTKAIKAREELAEAKIAVADMIRVMNDKEGDEYDVPRGDGAFSPEEIDADTTIVLGDPRNLFRQRHK